MSSLDELPLSTSAYIADTQHLSLIQHGAYLLILMTMWRAGGWIENDDRKLAIICKTSIAKWRKIAPDILPLLMVRGTKLSQKRLLFEVESALKNASKNRQNGRLGGIAKSLKSKEPSLANASISPPVSLADRYKPKKPALPSSSLPSLFRDSEVKESKKGKSGISLPLDWKPSPDEISYGLNLGLTEKAINGMAEDLRLWARSNANRPVGRKADWSAAFKGWMRREAKPKGQSSGGSSGFAAVAARLHEMNREDGR